MKITTFKPFFFESLKNIYPNQEVNSFFKILLNHIGIQQIDIALNPSLELKPDHLSFLNDALHQLEKEQPIQYIIGTTAFFGLTFKVDKRVLIPRPETEELVQWILDDCKNYPNNPITIADIGTGSGCIAIAMAKHIPNARVYAYDISVDALKIAQENAQLNQVEIHFNQINILETNDLKQTFDIIISNPPYVRQMEKQQMKRNVVDFEPSISLFVEDENPLIFYDKICALAQKHLSKNGQLYFEINQFLGTEMLKLLQEKHFKNIILRKDFYEVNRMIKATF